MSFWRRLLDELTDRADRDLDRELRTHLDLEVEDQRKQGCHLLKPATRPSAPWATLRYQREHARHLGMDFAGTLCAGPALSRPGRDAYTSWNCSRLDRRVRTNLFPGDAAVRSNANGLSCAGVRYSNDADSGGAAANLPAPRAARVDPMVALKYE
jgi:hypothetical protein